MSRICTCEQVSDGHVDKICDQIADAVVTDCLRHDPNSRVAVECMFKGNIIMIAGEITSDNHPDYAELAAQVFERIGLGRMFDTVVVRMLITRQSPDIAVGVDRGGAGDQGVMYGYATNETPELLPIPFAVATRFIKLLRSSDLPMLKPDAKAQVSYDYETGHISTFLCSVQHAHDTSVESIRPIIKSLMTIAAAAYGLNTDFEKLVNPTGKFVIGGSIADTGVTGRKLACDTYGGIGRIGGGALSGKDPSKVDRSGAYMARKIAVDLVRAGYCEKCEVQIAYAIGRCAPIAVTVDAFDTERISLERINELVSENYDLTPRGIIRALHLLDVDYNEVSSGGHFGKPWLPWEMEDEKIEAIYGNGG